MKKRVEEKHVNEREFRNEKSFNDKVRSKEREDKVRNGLKMKEK